MIEEKKQEKSVETESRETEQQVPVAKNDSFWKVAVVVLFILIAAQTGMMFKLMDNRTSAKPAASPPTAAEKPIVLKPRVQTPANPAPKVVTCPTFKQPAPAPRQPVATGTNTLSPQPLPRLNVNVNPGTGSGPVITAAPARPATRGTQWKSTRGVPTQTIFPGSAPGMSIHISQMPFDPFGPSFGMNIREEIARMERMMNAMMSGFGPNAMPSVGMLGNGTPFARRMGGSFVNTPAPFKEENGNYVVKLNIPGLDKTQVDAKVSGNILTVSGTKREEVNNSGRGFQTYSSSVSTFANSFPLPGPVKADKVKVSYDKKSGILTVRVPKK